MLNRMVDKVRRSAELAERLSLSKRDGAILLGLQLSSTLFELLGLLVMLPLFQYVQAEGDVAGLVEEHELWHHLVSAYGFVGLEVTLATLLATSFVCLMVRQGFTYVRLVYRASCRFIMIARLRRTVFRRYMWAGAGYHDRHPVGQIVNDLAVQIVTCVENVLSGVSLLSYAIIVCCYVVGLFVISVPTTVTALLVLGLGMLALRRQMLLSRETGRNLVQANQVTGEFIVERLQNVRLVRLSGTEAAEQEEIDELTERQRKVSLRLQTLNARIELLLEPIVIGSTFLFIYLSLAVFSVPFAQVGLFCVFIVRLLPIVKEMARVYQSRMGSGAALNAVDKLISDMANELGPRGGATIFTGLARQISMRDVRFRYSTRTDVAALDGLSLDIPAGMTTAVVGPSGAGKSTLIDMLPRLRQPDSGEILLDDTPIEAFTLETLRGGIAYVPQTAQLFNVSVAQHIRYGKPDATDDEVREAARLANCLSFIDSLPDGFDTSVGQRGGGLSGGQRQRLDLARALVRRAPILILDEPTSSLDAEAEAAFIAALRRIRAETSMTILIVTHRLSTAQIADRIAVLQAGRVTASGTSAELVSQSEWYREALRTQQSDHPLLAEEGPPVAAAIANAGA